jgi:hypothetical protein
MSVVLSRRLSALEAKITPTGKPIVIWGMGPNCEPMTDSEIEAEITAQRCSAPASAEFTVVQWNIV